MYKLLIIMLFALMSPFCYANYIDCKALGQKGWGTAWEFVSAENTNEVFLIYGVGIDEETGVVSGIAEDGPAYLQNSTCDTQNGMVTLQWNSPETNTSGKITGTISYESVVARLDVMPGSYITIKNKQIFILPTTYISGWGNDY